MSSEAVPKHENFSAVNLTGSQRKKRFKANESFRSSDVSCSLWDLFLKFDLFGAPIELTYTGAHTSGSTYRTGFGGLVTLLGIAICVAGVIVDGRWKNDRVDMWLNKIEDQFQSQSQSILELRRDLGNTEESLRNITAAYSELKDEVQARKESANLAGSNNNEPTSSGSDTTQSDDPTTEEAGSETKEEGADSTAATEATEEQSSDASPTEDETSNSTSQDTTGEDSTTETTATNEQSNEPTTDPAAGSSSESSSEPANEPATEDSTTANATSSEGEAGTTAEDSSSSSASASDEASTSGRRLSTQNMETVLQAPRVVLVKDGMDRRLVSPVDMVVYFVGMWFIISQILVGPIIRTWIARPLWIAEMGCNLFYVLKNKNSDFTTASGEHMKSDDPGVFEHKALLQKLAMANKSFRSMNPFGSRVKIEMDSDNMISSGKASNKGNKSGPRILVDSNKSSLKQNDESNLNSQRPSENQSLLHQPDYSGSASALSSSVRVGAATKKKEEGNPFGGDLEKFGDLMEGGESILSRRARQKEFSQLGFNKPSFSTAMELLLTPNREDADMLHQIEAKLNYQLDSLTLLRSSIDTQVLLQEGGVFGLTDLQRSLLNFNKRKILAPILQERFSFEDDVGLSEEFMEEKIVDWIKKLSSFKQGVEEPDIKDIQKYSNIILNDYSDEFSHSSVNQRLVRGLPERAKLFIREQIKDFETAYIDKANELKIETKDIQPAFQQQIIVQSAEPRILVQGGSIEGIVPADSSGGDQNAETKIEESQILELPSMRSPENVVSQTVVQPFVPPTSQAPSATPPPNSSKLDTLPVKDEKALSEFEREFDDILAKKQSQNDTDKANKVVDDFEKEMNSKPGAQKTNPSLTTQSLHPSPVQPQKDGSTTLADQSAAEDEPGAGRVEQTEIEDVDLDKVEDGQQVAAEGHGVQFERNAQGGNIKLKVKNNMNKNFNALKQQKTNMGDIKSQLTQKNVVDRLFSKNNKEGFFDIDEGEDEYDEEEEEQQAPARQDDVINEEDENEEEAEDYPDTTHAGANTEENVGVSQPVEEKEVLIPVAKLETQNKVESGLVYGRLLGAVEDDGLKSDDDFEETAAQTISATPASAQPAQGTQPSLPVQPAQPSPKKADQSMVLDRLLGAVDNDLLSEDDIAEPPPKPESPMEVKQKQADQALVFNRLLGAAEDPLMSEDDEANPPQQAAEEKKSGSPVKEGDVPTPDMSLDRIENELNNPIAAKGNQRQESEPQKGGQQPLKQKLDMELEQEIEGVLG